MAEVCMKAKKKKTKPKTLRNLIIGVQEGSDSGLEKMAIVERERKGNSVSPSP